MVNWGQIREKGKRRIVLLYGIVLSIPLILDYYIVKYLLKSFRLDFTFVEFLIVSIFCIFLGFILALLIWHRMEKDWSNTNSFFKKRG